MMKNTAKNLQTELINDSSWKLNSPVLVVDSDEFVLRRYSSRLANAGFTHVSAAESIDLATEHLEKNPCDLIFLDLSNGSKKEEVFTFVELARYRGYRGVFAIISAEPSYNDIYKAAIIGANDFFLKGSNLDIVNETLELLGRNQCSKGNSWHSDTAKHIGFFRSAGLTKQEINMVAQFAKGFPKYCQLAARLGRSDSYIHKSFSRIYEKMSVKLSVENPSQLSHLITVCSLFK